MTRLISWLARPVIRSFASRTPRTETGPGQTWCRWACWGLAAGLMGLTGGLTAAGQTEAAASVAARPAPVSTLEDAPLTQVRATPDLAGLDASPLPDAWSKRRPHYSGTIHYTFQMTAEPQVVYIDEFCGKLGIRLNGQPIWNSEGEPDRRWGTCQQDLVVALPPALMHRGADQVLVLSLQAESQASGPLISRGGVMGRVATGSYVAAKKAQQHAAWWREGVRHTLAGVVLAFAIVLISLGIAIRTKQQLLPLGMACALWCMGDFIVTEGLFELSVASRQGLWFCLLIPAMTMLALYMRLMQGAQPSWRCALWFIPSALSPLCLWLLPNAMVQAYATLALAGMSGYLAWEALRWSRLLGQQPRDFSHNLIRLALVTSPLFLLAAALWRNSAQPEVIMDLAEWITPWLMAVLGLSVMRQLSDELLHAQHEQARAELLVKETSAQLARNFEHLAAYRAHQATEQERKRIASDLHDDLGAKLLTIVHTSQHEDIAQLAREALDEMRLSVRGLSGRAMPLADALADWRVECLERLEAAKIELEWQHGGEDSGFAELGGPDEWKLSARQFAQTTRILREATNNIIKHSGAQRAQVSWVVDQENLSFSIRDYGRGISEAEQERFMRSQGMISMKRRAKSIQGQCLVESGPGYGTLIRVTVPLRPDEPMA